MWTEPQYNLDNNLLHICCRCSATISIISVRNALNEERYQRRTNMDNSKKLSQEQLEKVSGGCEHDSSEQEVVGYNFEKETVHVICGQCGDDFVKNMNTGEEIGKYDYSN